MTPKPTDRTTSFTVRMPDGWFEFDLWRATRTGELARTLDRRIDETPQLARLRGPLLKFLREAADEAERRGAVFTAAMVEPLGDKEFLIATAVGAVTSGPPGSDSQDIDVIASQITARPESRTAGGTTIWRKVEVTSVPAGRCVRVTAVDEAEAPGGASVSTVSMQTLVPVPGEHAVLNLVLSSPQASLAGPMLDLFDAISATLDWDFDTVVDRP